NSASTASWVRAATSPSETVTNVLGPIAYSKVCTSIAGSNGGVDCACARDALAMAMATLHAQYVPRAAPRSPRGICISTSVLGHCTAPEADELAPTPALSTALGYAPDTVA